MLWYWRINDIIKNQQEQTECLQQQNQLLAKQNELLKAFSGTNEQPKNIIES
jgi:hypothetical protein